MQWAIEQSSVSKHSIRAYDDPSYGLCHCSESGFHTANATPQYQSSLQGHVCDNDHILMLRKMAKRLCCPDQILGNSQKATQSGQGPCVHRENTEGSTEWKCYHRSLLIFLHLIFPFYFSFLHNPNSLQDKESLHRDSHTLPSKSLPSIYHSWRSTPQSIPDTSSSAFPLIHPLVLSLIFFSPTNLTLLSTLLHLLFLPLCITHTVSILHLHSSSFLSFHPLHPTFLHCF